MEELKRKAFENISDKPARHLKSPATNQPVLNDIAGGVCPTCGERVGEFKDELSRKEYTISGMCQKCQDSVFGR